MRVFHNLKDYKNICRHYFHFGGESLNEIFKTKFLNNSLHFSICKDFVGDIIEMDKIKFKMKHKCAKTKIFLNDERNIVLIFYFEEILSSYKNANLDDNNYKPKFVFWYDFMKYIETKNNIYIHNFNFEFKSNKLKEHFKDYAELIYILKKIYNNYEIVPNIYYYNNSKYTNIYKYFEELKSSNISNIGYIVLSNKINIKEYVNKAIEENRIQKYSVYEDGSCLFHCLAQYLSNMTSDGLRQEIVKYENKYMKELIEPFLEIKFEDYLREMMKTTTFGGEPEIIAFTNLYKLQVAIYDVERRNTLLYGDFNKTIFLLFHKTCEHYEILDIKT